MRKISHFPAYCHAAQQTLHMARAVVPVRGDDHEFQRNTASIKRAEVGNRSRFVIDGTPTDIEVPDGQL